MKALVKKHRKVGLVLEDVPKPTIGPNDVLIKIEKMAICGTDLHIYNWDEWAQATIPTPMVVGHEYFGTIAEVGELVEGYSVGDRVSGEGHITCGYCRNCRAGRPHLCRNTIGVGVNRPGSFAEYLSLPARNVFKIDPKICGEMASVFDPLGNAVHTALAFDLVGEDVLITGAGPIGCMAVAIAKHCGARHVVATDINPYRLDLARKMGATLALDVRNESIEGAMKTLAMTEGFDVGLEMSGHPAAFASMLKTMNHGGNIAILGIFPKAVEIDWHDVIFKGLTLKGIYGREMFETWYKMSAMLQSGLDIKELIITHRYKVDQFEEAFAVLNTGNAGKVILEW